MSSGSKGTEKSGSGSSLIAACIGGVVALCLAALLQFAGFLGTPGGSDDASQALTDMQARLSTLEGQIANLPEPGASQSEVTQLVDQQISAIEQGAAQASEALEADIAELRERLVALSSQAQPAVDSELTQSMAELRNDVAALKESLSQQSTAPDAGEPAAPSSTGDAVGEGRLASAVADLEAAIATLGSDVDKKLAAVSQSAESNTAQQTAMGASIEQLGARLAAVDTGLEQINADIAALRERLENGADRRAAAAIAAAALKSDIDSGQPFAASLANLRNFAAGADDLGQLDAFADSGIPPVSQLASEFETTVATAIEDATRPLEDGGLASRLAAGARALVDVRPIGEIEGDSPRARISQISAALRSGDLSRASQVWSALPEAAQAVSEDWHARLQARLTANTVVRGTIDAVLSSASDG